MNNKNAFFNWPDIWLERWTGEGTSNDLPMVLWNGSSDDRCSDFRLVNASYARLKTISLGYTIELKKIGTIRAYIAGENLITLVRRDYVGWDPEQYGQHDGLAQYNAWSDTYPGASVYTIGFNLTLR